MTFGRKEQKNMKLFHTTDLILLKVGGHMLEKLGSQHYFCINEEGKFVEHLSILINE